jgi:hypothetical protein
MVKEIKETRMLLVIIKPIRNRQSSLDSFQTNRSSRWGENIDVLNNIRVYTHPPDNMPRLRRLPRLPGSVDN